MNINSFHWWCLTTDNNSRHKDIDKEFKKLDIDVEYYVNVNGGLYNLIGKKLTELQTDYYTDMFNSGYHNVHGNVLSCLLGFYYIFKQSYIRNYNNIIICEDDFKFLLNKIELNDLISKIPNNYDVVKFVHSLVNSKNNKVVSGDYYNFPLYNINDPNPFIEKVHITTNIWNAYSRKAIIKYLNILDKHILVADRVLTYDSQLKFYLSKYKVADYNIYQSSLLN